MTTADEVLHRFRDFAGLPVAAWRAFLAGDDAAREAFASPSDNLQELWLLEDLLACVSAPSAFSDGDRRLLAGIGAVDRLRVIPLVGRWLAAHALRGAPAGEAWLEEVARALSLDAANTLWLATQVQALDSAVRALLAADDSALRTLVETRPVAAGVAAVLAAHAPERLVAILPAPQMLATPGALALGAAVLPRGALDGKLPRPTSSGHVCLHEHLAPSDVPGFGARVHAALGELVRAKHLAAAHGLALEAHVADGAPLDDGLRRGLGYEAVTALSVTLPLARTFNDAAHRLAALLAGLPHGRAALFSWADVALRAEAREENAFAVLMRACDASAPRAEWLKEAAQGVLAFRSVRGTTSYGRWLVDLDDATLRLALETQLMPRSLSTLAFMIVPMERPERLPLIAELLRAQSSDAYLRLQAAIVALESSRAPAAVALALALDRERAAAPVPPHEPSRPWLRQGAVRSVFEAWKRLAMRDRARNLGDATAAIRALVADNEWLSSEAADWFVRTHGSDARAELTAWLAAQPVPPHGVSPVAHHLLQAFGANAPEAVAAFLAGPGYLQLTAIRRIIAGGVPVEDARVAAPLASILDQGEPSYVVQALDVAARAAWQWVEPRAWALLASSSGRVRLAAARHLAAHKDEATSARAAEMLAHKQAPARLGAIALLSLLDAAAAGALFEARLDNEPNEAVRDALLRALADSWARAGRRSTWADVERRVAKAKPARALAPWLDPASLPPLFLADGVEVPKPAVAWLLARQARVKGVDKDLDADMLYRLIDRARSGAFAAHLLQGFLGAGALAEDGFVLTVVGALGDERVVAPLTEAVHSWVKEKRGAFAEYGVRALALLDIDAALKSVDDLALRYTEKPKNVGEAAVEAFDDAAERRGVTPDALRDRVVPWLGFPEDGSPWVVDVEGGKRIVIAIDDEFAVTLRDAKTNKPVKSMPKSSPVDVKALRALVKEAAAIQAARLQNLMVVGSRWSRARFESLFLRVPILRPFAHRLVWRTDDGRAFIADEVGRFVDAAGASVALSGDDLLSLAHPLHLTPTLRTAWQARLGAQPFAQLSRAVAQVKDEDRAATTWHHIDGSEMPTRAVKGMTARLGWRRGDTTGGYVGSYWKAFPFADVVAHLAMDDMPVVLDMSASATVRELSFVRQGGGRVALGDIDPIVFSEAVADACAIAGKEPPS